MTTIIGFIMNKMLSKKGFIFIKLSIDPKLQEERIEKTYGENKNIHLFIRRNDISEIYTDELEFDYEIKIDKSNEHTLIDFIEKQYLILRTIFNKY